MLRIESIENEPALKPLIRTLLSEYANELNENLCFQSFGDELDDPFKKYGSPTGALLIAHYNNEPAGCIALQKIARDSTCEMKRLYVRPAYRRYGIGDALVKKLLEEAMRKQYRCMVLDTLTRLEAAIRLYHKYGFIETTAYYKNPLPNVVYMEKML